MCAGQVLVYRRLHVMGELKAVAVLFVAIFDGAAIAIMDHDITTSYARGLQRFMCPADPLRTMADQPALVKIQIGRELRARLKKLGGKVDTYHEIVERIVDQWEDSFR